MNRLCHKLFQLIGFNLIICCGFFLIALKMCENEWQLMFWGIETVPISSVYGFVCTIHSGSQSRALNFCFNATSKLIYTTHTLNSTIQLSIRLFGTWKFRSNNQHTKQLYSDMFNLTANYTASGNKPTLSVGIVCNHKSSWNVPLSGFTFGIRTHSLVYFECNL